MRLTVKFRTLCLAGVAVVAVLAAGEALARGGGRSAAAAIGSAAAATANTGAAAFTADASPTAAGGGPPISAAIGVGALAATAVTGAAITAAAGFIMAMSAITATTSLKARRPMAAGRRVYAPNYYPAPGYQAPTVVYPPAVYPSYAPVVSYGSDPHIIHLHATRHRRARKSCNCRAE